MRLEFNDSGTRSYFDYQRTFTISKNKLAISHWLMIGTVTLYCTMASSSEESRMLSWDVKRCFWKKVWNFHIVSVSESAKILATLGRNPIEVREHIKDAYAIRSTFAHGGHLDYKAKKKLDRKYGGVKKLLHSLLDYLRVSILVSIMSRMSKEELVDLVDDALIDSVKNDELRNRISDTKVLIGA